MDQVYQETVCIQPLVIATHYQPRLIEIEDEDDFDNDQDDGATATMKETSDCNFQNLEYG